MFAFDEETKWILGRPNFWCGGFAELLRRSGQEIPHKAEEEQAAVIYWMLCQYEQHGDNWRQEADKTLKRSAKTDQQTNREAVP